MDILRRSSGEPGETNISLDGITRIGERNLLNTSLVGYGHEAEGTPVAAGACVALRIDGKALRAGAEDSWRQPRQVEAVRAALDAEATDVLFGNGHGHEKGQGRGNKAPRGGRERERERERQTVVGD